MATVQNPFRAPPGTVIRPDGMPAGRGGRWAIWFSLIVLGVAGISYVVEHAPRAADDDTVVRAAPVLREEAPRPEPPPPEPEPIVDPMRGHFEDAAPAAPEIAVYGMTIDDVHDGISKIQARIDKCGDRPHASGAVIVEVNVSATGRVVDVLVAETPDKTLGKCVGKAIERAKFVRSRDGAQFTMPFGF